MYVGMLKENNINHSVCGCTVCAGVCHLYKCLSLFSYLQYYNEEEAKKYSQKWVEMRINCVQHIDSYKHFLHIVVSICN